MFGTKTDVRNKNRCSEQKQMFGTEKILTNGRPCLLFFIKGKTMCLSKVFLKNIDPENLIVDEVMQITQDRESVSMRTLFGEEKKMEGYSIGEVNLMKNYIVLKNR
jgi:predicted RNA-binding protein